MENSVNSAATDRDLTPKNDMIIRPSTFQSFSKKTILKKKSFYGSLTDSNNIPTRDKDTEVNFRDNIIDVLNFLLIKVVEVESYKKFNQMTFNDDDSSKCCTVF